MNSSFPSKGFLHFVPSEVDFETSICNDVKQVVAALRREAHANLVANSEKRNIQSALSRTRILLAQVKGYRSAIVVAVAIQTLEGSLSGNDPANIRLRCQRLTAASRYLPEYVNHLKVRGEALEEARADANRELTQTQMLLGQANGYGKQSQVASTLEPLALALALSGSDPEEIRTRLQPLLTVNRDLHQYIQDQRATVEKKQQEASQSRVP